MLIHRLLPWFLVLLAACTPVAAQSLQGRVVGINDGDTLTLLTPDNRQVKIRLAQIDTPEKAQPYGSRARQALADLVFQKSVRVEVSDIDRYGRTVGTVMLGDLDVNAEMVRNGSAWVYRRYARDSRLFELEDQARAAGSGLWALPEAQRVPPWEWRQASRGGQAAQGGVPPEDLRCGAKRYCSQMSSCEEARFHFRQCGQADLDGDGDGIPCELLCR
jgi:endonuclease YncB( thermonuclease family)